MQNHSRQEQRPTLPAGLPQLLAGRQALTRHLEEFQDTFVSEGRLDQRLLELCRTRLDALHQQAPASTLVKDEAAQISAGVFDSLTTTEQQALGLVEQLAIDAHQVSAEQFKTVADELGPSATVTLLTAMAMHDANLRLRRVLGALATTRG